MQIFVHRWDDLSESWSDTPAAFTQSIVTPRKIINGTLFVLAMPEERERLSSDGTTLEPGRVQLRVYLDREDKLANSPTLMLNDREPDATVVFDAKFDAGFQNADVLDGIKTE